MKNKFLLGLSSLFLSFALLAGCATNDNDQIDDTPIDPNNNNGEIMDGDDNVPNGHDGDISEDPNGDIDDNINGDTNGGTNNGR